MTDVDGNATQTPVITQEEFLRELQELVTEDAPRVFALCEEIGHAEDGLVRYWGMAFDDHTDLVSTDGGLRGSFHSPETAHQLLSRTRNLHLVWA